MLRWCQRFFHRGAPGEKSKELQLFHNVGRRRRQDRVTNAARVARPIIPYEERGDVSEAVMEAKVTRDCTRFALAVADNPKLLVFRGKAFEKKHGQDRLVDFTIDDSKYGTTASGEGPSSSSTTSSGSKAKNRSVYAFHRTQAIKKEIRALNAAIESNETLPPLTIPREVIIARCRYRWGLLPLRLKRLLHFAQASRIVSNFFEWCAVESCPRDARAFAAAKARAAAEKRAAAKIAASSGWAANSRQGSSAIAGGKKQQQQRGDGKATKKGAGGRGKANNDDDGVFSDAVKLIKGSLGNRVRRKGIFDV